MAAASKDKQDDPTDEEDGKTRGLRKRLKWLLWLPVPPSLACWGWLKGLFCTSEMKSRQRAAEKERQAGIRRELRGLPAETPDEQK